MIQDGNNIGYVQLIPVENEYEVGYHIAKPYTNNSYATEALQAFLDFILAHKNIDKVYGICDIQNYASIRVLEKCGFEKIYQGLGQDQGQNKHIVKYIYYLDNK